MVDPINLVFVERTERRVALSWRAVSKIPPERLLDDDLRVVALPPVPPAHAAGAQVLDDRLKDRRRGRDVEEGLHLAADALLDLLDVLGEPVEPRLLIVFAAYIRSAGRHPFPDLAVKLPAGELLDGRLGDLSELPVRKRLPAIADEVEVRRKEVVKTQVVNRGNELARGEITRSSKNHHHRRRSASVLAQTLEKGMSFGVGHGICEMFWQVGA